MMSGGQRYGAGWQGDPIYDATRSPPVKAGLKVDATTIGSGRKMVATSH
jgi:hypothetical protein